ncbi:lysine--tRNA ligase [Hyphomonas pacifica]|uniref:Lysine--tRNA ligase n=1 Tax=Hyphomonas pacifica TaxID=1280941 RepID=A0A062TPR0_9PROT|nr:lysine--tRNA ligase [Hyphomonas pacifica]KCZ48395.1 lysyl-tRNA synthetase [Hyphomonas pacifica]RAN31707.1 lysyl-tRNA synthetase [Hyphomonas pacifica]RAN32100.1 lysyl-tRNA synthetase [Hyphomonas pacifica]
MTDLSTLAQSAKAWPFELARKLEQRVEQQIKAGQRAADDPVTFETGYGPSGLPHIGTFGEVVRTTMVRHAFEVLTAGKYTTRLICVSDDMDGMRKVPPTVPNPEKLEPYLQQPLTAVPDPFGTHDSYGAHMNARLCAFLDQFGFEYEFLSATDCYKSGRFDDMLLRAAQKYKDIMDVMLPTLGEERQATYSPFLPIHPETGEVLYVPMKAVDGEKGTVTFEDEAGKEFTVPVTGGHVKMQWKPDFGMRWAALGVDFEMFGKDHQANAPIYSKITKILGKRPPEQYVYEMFLDDKGEKISKTKGNGISVEDWLKYAPDESLSLFQFQKPRVAKKLYFDVIPKAVDEYLTFLEKYPEEEPARQIENPVWHIHSGNPPQVKTPVSFALLLNLVAVANPEDKSQLWGFISQYAPEASPETHPMLDKLAGYAMSYYTDFVLPEKTYRAPTDKERAAMEDLSARFKAFSDEPTSENLQTLTFSVGKEHEFDNLREWFQALYEVLLGQSQGPRFGSFAALYGVANTARLIDDALARG